MSLKRLLTALLLLLPLLPLGAQPSRIETVVVDPGHGGHDAGAIGEGKVYEKNLTLAISKKFVEQLRKACPDLTVKMTRETDVFVELAQRARIANKAKAQLFISIHINSSKSSSAAGPQVYSLTPDKMGSNITFINRNNDDTVFLEEDADGNYKEMSAADAKILRELNAYSNVSEGNEFARCIYDALSRIGIKTNRTGDQLVRQDNFQVLREAVMPSVLVEVGYISNPSNLQIMKTPEGQDKIAGALLEAFLAYKKSREADAPKEEAAPKDEPQEVLYGIQVAAGANKLSVKDKFFRGYQPLILRAEGEKLYKYVICPSSSLSEVKASLEDLKKKKFFEGCYLVKVEGEKVSRVR